MTEEKRKISLEEKKKQRRARDLSDIRTLVATPEGRRFYWRLLEEGRIFLGAFAGDSVNYTNYQLGRQSIAQDFLKDLFDAKPSAFQEMQREHESEAKNDEIQEQEVINDKDILTPSAGSSPMGSN